jgi:hypothetical protein
MTTMTQKLQILALMLLLVMATSVFSVCTAFAADSAVTAKEKLPTFLGDVLQIDLSKYTVTNEGYGVLYPMRFGGEVKQESYSFNLDGVNSQVSVSAVFYNGYIAYLQVRPVTGLVIFSQHPTDSAVANTRRILENYKTFAQKFGIDTSNIPLALSMLSQVSDAPKTTQTSQNFYGISGFNPVNTTSGNMRLVASGSEIGFGYTFAGVDVFNRGLGMGFASNSFLFDDTWGLYTVAGGSAITKQQASALALEAAEKYMVNLIQNGSFTALLPDWSNPRVEISLNMVSGQSFNNTLNNTLNFVNSSVVREPLVLYPLWGAFVYFTTPLGNIDGIQVGIWGDTSEVAQLNTFSQLQHTLTPIATPPTAPNNGLTIALIVVAVMVVLAVVALAFKKRKQR